MNKLIKKYLDIKTNEMIEASRLQTTVMFNSNLDIINNEDIYMTNEETLKSLTAKIKKVIPDKDASFMGEEFEYKFTLEDVLMAIEIKKPTIKITNADSLDYGKIADITDEEKIGIMEIWNLGKPLHLQSEETLKEILKLLR